MQRSQSCPVLLPREAELQQPLRSADLRAALPVICLVKHFDVAISTISLSHQHWDSPSPSGSEILRDAFHLRQQRAPQTSTQGDWDGCYCNRHRLLLCQLRPRASAPAAPSGSQSTFLSHQCRSFRVYWSKDGLAFTKRCHAVTTCLLFKRDFTVPDFMTCTA